jgi:peptidoglycan-N-acetylglucosamine deacetylase
MRRGRGVAIIGGVVASLLVAGVGLRAVAKSRTYQLFSRPIAHVTTSDSIVALTFDDGPTTARVDSLISILQSRNVHATFFLIGAELARAPEAGKALVAAGHELGNHTYSHDHMVFKTMRTYREQISRTDPLLRIAGSHDPIFFRPPYGYKLIGLPFVLWRTGRKTVTWDIEPESFSQAAASADGIVRHVLSRVRPGSIILLHPWYSSGAAARTAVPVLIDSLRSRGYRITTVGELLAHEIT